jgi:hypothetical protein
MLKEVGASGQISLGKKYAGRLFEMQVAEDGCVTLSPVQVVPLVQEELALYGVNVASAGRRLRPSGPRPERDPVAAHAQWEADNRDAIEAMDQRLATIGSMAQRVQAWRKRQGV